MILSTSPLSARTTSLDERSKIRPSPFDDHPIKSLREDNSLPLTLASLDKRVAQVINAGGIPLFVQAISNIGRTHSDARNAAVHSQYLDLKGKPYAANSDATTPARIATNMTYLVNRYKNAPFNLDKQSWEIGNGPDLENVHYRVQDTAEYIANFRAIHDQLTAGRLRDNITLCGPGVSWDHGSAGFRDALMTDFLAACGRQVNVVTRHVYGFIHGSGSADDLAYALLNDSIEIDHFDGSHTGNRPSSFALQSPQPRDHGHQV